MVRKKAVRDLLNDVRGANKLRAGYLNAEGWRCQMTSAVITLNGSTSHDLACLRVALPPLAILSLEVRKARVVETPASSYKNGSNANKLTFAKVFPAPTDVRANDQGV